MSANDLNSVAEIRDLTADEMMLVSGGLLAPIILGIGFFIAAFVEPHPISGEGCGRLHRDNVGNKI